MFIIVISFDFEMLLSILVVLMFAAVFPLALYDYCKDWTNYLRGLYKTKIMTRFMITELTIKAR